MDREDLPYPFNLIDIGDVIHYWPSPSHRGTVAPAPMTVTFIGNESVNGLFLFALPDRHGFGGRHGIKHVADEFWNDPAAVHGYIENDEGGCFELHPKTLKLIELEKQVADLAGVMA